MYQSAAAGQADTVPDKVPVLPLRRRVTVLVYPLAFAGGSAVWLTTDTALNSPFVLLTCALISLTVRLRTETAFLRILSALILSAVAGAFLAGIRTHVAAAPRLTTETPITDLEGRVVAIEHGRTSLRLRIVPHAIDGLDRSALPRSIRITHRSALTVRPGQDVRCRVRLRPPPTPSIPGEYDFGLSAYFQGLGAVGYALGACKLAVAAAPRDSLTSLAAWRDSMRRDVAEYVYAHTGRGGGMATAMISGDRSFMAPADAEALRISGLGHLLAISGLHMGLVIGAVFLAVRRLWPLIEPLAQIVPTPKAAAVIALLAAGWYLILSGASVSTQRAFVMGAVALGAVLADRSALSLASVSSAMWIIMVLRPESVLMPGFQMSFAATAALIALYQNWPRRRHRLLVRIPMWALSLLACSAVTFAATTPFAIYHFGRAAPLSVVSNMLAMPIISLVTAPSALIAGLGSVLGLAEVPLAVTGISLATILEIAHGVAARDPGLSPTPMPELALVLFVAAIVIAVLMQGRWRALCALPLAAAIFTWAVSGQPVAHVTAGGTVYLRAESGWLVWRADGARETGLRPLSIRERVLPLDCRRPVCRHATEAGGVTVERDGLLRYRPAGSERDAEVVLAEAEARGGASVIAGPMGVRVRFQRGASGVLRPWQRTGEARR